MSDEPTFSVVVPCYNYGHYLAGTLESIRAQGRPDVQVLVIDDASTDDTSEVAARFSDFVQYHRNERNLGAGGAWRRGVELATGRYLFKLDADDEWLPGILNEIEQAFDANPRAAIAIASTLVRDEETGELSEDRICDERTVLEPEQFRDLLLRGFFFRMPGCALRRSCLLGQEGPDAELFQIHDWEYFLRITRRHGAVLLSTPLAIYREHSGSISALARSEARLKHDIDRWLSLAIAPGSRQIRDSELDTLRGSLAILLMTGLGSRTSIESLPSLARSYIDALRVAAGGGITQLLRLHGALATKVVKKLGRQ